MSGTAVSYYKIGRAVRLCYAVQLKILVQLRTGIFCKISKLFI